MHIRHLAIDLVLVVAKLRAAFVTFFPVQKNFTYKHPSIDTTHADTRRHAERERERACVRVDALCQWDRKMAPKDHHRYLLLLLCLPSTNPPSLALALSFSSSSSASFR